MSISVARIDDADFSLRETLPKITIVIASLNAQSSIEAAINSVLAQTYSNIELVVIDGGSKDGTVDIIKKFDDKISYWSSEPDGGIYEAINKGLDAAKGEWVFFLGADDRISSPDTFRHIYGYLSKDLSVVFGNISYDEGRIVRSRLNLLTLLHNTLHHQSALYNAELFDGWRYDSSLHLISDYELNLIIYLGRQKYFYVDEVISCCGSGGRSRIELEQSFRETNIVRNRHLGPFWGRLLSFLYHIKFSLRH